MPKQVRTVTIALSTLAILAGAEVSADEGDIPIPRESGLQEHAESRLAQFDFSVRIKNDARKKAIRNQKKELESQDPSLITLEEMYRIRSHLTAKDFFLAIGGKHVTNFIVDANCPLPQPNPGQGEERPPAATRSETFQAAPRYLIYFDDQMFTVAGRNHAVHKARVTIPRLMHGGAQGMVVSSGKTLVSWSSWTEDAEEVLAAINRYQSDHIGNNESLVGSEEINRKEIEDASREESDRAAQLLVRLYALQEQASMKRALARLGLALYYLQEFDPPRNLLYFSDNLRKKAGQHYIDIFGADVAFNSPELQRAQTGVEMFQLEFQKLLEQATAKGIHIYAISGVGLRPGSEERFTYANDTLHTLANETGGKAIVGGARNRLIAETILEDTRCRYLLSFPVGREPDGVVLPEDQELRVRLELPGHDFLQVEAQGLFSLASRSRRQTEEILAAFAVPGVAENQL